MSFFAADSETKLRYGTPRRMVGYRPLGYSYAYSPDRRSLNDSFLYWKDRGIEIEHRAEIADFLTALESYRGVVVDVTLKLLEILGDRYNYRRDIAFTKASLLQVNSFPGQLDDEFLQHRHEDRVLFTLLWASAPGLELYRGSEVIPLIPRTGEMLVMPGSILTAMTGGEIKPAYHHMRNHHHDGRKSIMYFVSPDIEHEITPYVSNAENLGIDIRELSVKNPQAFGLPPDFLTAR